MSAVGEELIRWGCWVWLELGFIRCSDEHNLHGSFVAARVHVCVLAPYCVSVGELTPQGRVHKYEVRHGLGAVAWTTAW